MTVLGLRLSRRANAFSALHGEVSRHVDRLYRQAGRSGPHQPHHNGVHVPTWLAPQMIRLYDRHPGVGWQEHSGECASGRHRAVDDGGVGSPPRLKSVVGIRPAAREGEQAERGEKSRDLGG